jgi:hypothetical protein
LLVVGGGCVLLVIVCLYVIFYLHLLVTAPDRALAYMPAGLLLGIGFAVYGYFASILLR